MGKNLKLSVIIPTYNGGLWIKDTIMSVLYQIGPFKDKVEFIIRNNASTDDTKEVICECDKLYPGIIRYIETPETIVSYNNYIAGVKDAAGEFVQVLGDDDLFMPNYFQSILPLLEDKELDYIYLNRLITSREYDTDVVLHGKKTNKLFYKTYSDGGDLLNDYLEGPSLLSVNIIRRDVILDKLNSAKPFYDGYVFYSITVNSILDKKCMAFFPPMILQRIPRKRTWSDKMLLYVSDICDIFQDLDKRYPGINNKWKAKQKKEDALFYHLGCIYQNPQLYKNKKEQYYKFLTPFEKFHAIMLLHFRPFYYFYFFEYNLFKIGQLFADNFIDVLKQKISWKKTIAGQ